MVVSEDEGLFRAEVDSTGVHFDADGAFAVGARCVDGELLRRQVEHLAQVEVLLETPCVEHRHEDHVPRFVGSLDDQDFPRGFHIQAPELDHRVILQLQQVPVYLQTQYFNVSVSSQINPIFLHLTNLRVHLNFIFK